MDRRKFLQSSAGLVAAASLAGCSGGGDTPPPPRRSRVFADVSIQQQAVSVQLVQQPRVESRKAVGNDGNLASLLGGLSPVGVASAQKGGRGATGRGKGGYSSAPKGRHGWALWHGHDDADDWREEHDDEIRMYPADVSKMGLAYLGTDDQYEDDPPGPGPVPWDESWDDPEEGTEATASLGAVSPGSTPAEGWYRVGVRLVHEDGGADFGWQGVDLEVDKEGSWIVDKAWHVKPRV
jgi:hypothetical protein